MNQERAKNCKGHPSLCRKDPAEGSGLELDQPDQSLKLYINFVSKQTSWVGVLLCKCQEEYPQTLRQL